MRGARRGALATQGGPRPGRPRPPTTEAQPLPEGSGAEAAKGAEADADRKAASAGPRIQTLARAQDCATLQRAARPDRAKPEAGQARLAALVPFPAAWGRRLHNRRGPPKGRAPAAPGGRPRGPRAARPADRWRGRGPRLPRAPEGKRGGTRRGRRKEGPAESGAHARTGERARSGGAEGLTPAAGPAPPQGRPAGRSRGRPRKPEGPGGVTPAPRSSAGRGNVRGAYAERSRPQARGAERRSAAGAASAAPRPKARAPRAAHLLKWPTEGRPHRAGTGRGPSRCRRAAGPRQPKGPRQPRPEAGAGAEAGPGPRAAPSRRQAAGPSERSERVAGAQRRLQQAAGPRQAGGRLDSVIV